MLTIIIGTSLHLDGSTELFFPLFEVKAMRYAQFGDTAALSGLNAAHGHRLFDLGSLETIIFTGLLQFFRDSSTTHAFTANQNKRVG